MVAKSTQGESESSPTTEGAARSSDGAVFKEEGIPKLSLHSLASRATVSARRSHKENAPSPGPIPARLKLIGSAESSGPPQVGQVRPRRASPEHRRPCPGPLPPGRNGPLLWCARTRSQSPPEQLLAASEAPAGSARALALRPAEKSRESPRVPRRQKQARPPPAFESARGRGEPVPAASLVPAAAEPLALAARTPRQVGGPRLPAGKRRERAQRPPLTSISKSGRRNAVRKSEQKCAMAGTSHQERSSPSPAEPPSSGHISPPRPLARSLALSPPLRLRPRAAPLSARRLPPLGVSTS